MLWKTISLCLCIYGILKEFRPSESYVVSYLVGPRMNFTVEQVNNEILPIGTYASLISMIFVFLTTDWLKYKIVIIIQALCGVGVYTLLSFCTNFLSVVAVQILYGIFSATEVAYYTYTYAVVDVKYYQRVTSYTRAAHLVGRFFSGLVAQVLITTKLVDSYQLNFLTLGSIAAATLWTSVLPSVKQIKPESKTQKMNVIYDGIEAKNDEPINIQENMSWKYIGSMCREYNNFHVLKWSFWVITATCCFNQVLCYIQSLWESLSHKECFYNVCSGTSEWNGAVDATYTIISAIILYLCSSIKLNMDKYGNIVIMVTSVVQCVTLYTPILFDSIYISYINFVIYCIIYQAVMTIASSEIAKSVSKDKHGFVFGVNNFLAVLIQSLATFFMNIGGLSSSAIILFEWYAAFCLFIGICYIILSMIQVFQK